MTSEAPAVDLLHEGSVRHNVEVAPGCWRMEIECPEVAAAALPGQFVMLRCRQSLDPLLSRAFSISDLVFEGDEPGKPAKPGEEGRPIGIVILQVVIGVGTGALAERQVGEAIGLLGPLGNPYDLGTEDEHLIMLAGGIGAAPFAYVARALRRRSPVQRATYLIGARSAEHLYLAGEIGEMAVDLGLATDDGSMGHHGFVTDLLVPLLEPPLDPPVRVIACGPNPMFKALASVVERARARGLDIPCEVSTEESMPCGYGACAGCVVPLVCDVTPDRPDGYRYGKSCVEGPVFPVDAIRWDLVRATH